ncbi:MAG: zinc ribbon domain-containing protein [Gemmatimonadota bacterium]|nr:zinc ribbon domain-containing protein [Gemmatimonadota bacterium]
MPIHEYFCRPCGEPFEVLVRKAGIPVSCPQCSGSDLDRLLSLPRVHSESTKAASIRAARARDARQGSDRIREQHEYRMNHDD